LAFELTEVQAADSPRFFPLLGKVKVHGLVGRPRTRPDAVAADKAYSSRANRVYLRQRRIKAVIPEKASQAANRKKRGSAGGRPVSHDADLYGERNKHRWRHFQWKRDSRRPPFGRSTRPPAGDTARRVLRAQVAGPAQYLAEA
jgi:hypothetical protein